MKRSPGRSLVGGDTEADHVHIGQCRAHHVVQSLPEQRPRPMQAGRVADDQLPIPDGSDAAYRTTGRLGLVRRDHDLLADNAW